MKQKRSNSENNIKLLEEGLYQDEQKCIKKMEFKTHCCTRCILYLRLIFLLEMTLFFGWGCYMILQIYLPRVTESETTSVTLERYPVIESSSEIQETRPSIKMPTMFVKSEIIDNINNLLEDMKLTKDQNLMQNKITDTASMVQINNQNSNNMRHNNIMGLYNNNKLLTTLLSGNLMFDEKFTKNSMPEKISSIESIDEDVNTYKKSNSLRYVQFLKKLPNISKVKADDLSKFESKNDFIEDIDYLTLKSQENYVLDMLNKPENLKFNVATISNLENSVDRTISVDLTNTLRDLKFSDLTKDAIQDDNSKDSSLLDEIDKRVKHLELDFVMYPFYESRESSDIIKDSTRDSSTSQFIAQEILEQIENGSSDDIDKRNVDKHDVNDSDMSAFENQDYIDTLMAIMQNKKQQHSSENIELKIEDKTYESTQPTMQDSVKFPTSNVDFQWFNVPPSFVDLESGDIPKSGEVHSSLFWDAYKEDIDDIIPESQCEITIKMGILKVKCPTIKFDEEWNFTSFEVPPTDIPKVTDFRDIFDAFLHTECNKSASEQLEIKNISNENFDNEVTMSQNNVSKIIDMIESLESTNAKISNDELIDLSDVEYIDSSDNGDSGENFEFYSFPFHHSNEEKMKQIDTTVVSSISEFDSDTVDSNERRNLFSDISDITQKQLKINEEDDYSVSHNNKTFLKVLEHFYDLEKELTFLLKNEMSNITARCLLKNSYENNQNDQNDICSILRYMHSISQHPWHEKYVLRKLFEHIQNPDYPYNTENYYHRKKRITYDLWQQDEISNTLEEDNEDVNLLENLKKTFQKMEILALCIDKLHERYLLHNKLDDDYASSEFPIETEEHRESYTKLEK